MAYRTGVSRKGSRKSFNGRASKTHKMNTKSPLRGGFRL